MQNSQERGAREEESCTYGATYKMASCLHPWENISQLFTQIIERIVHDTHCVQT